MLQNQRHFLFSASATVEKNAISQSLFAVMKNKLSFYLLLPTPISLPLPPSTLFHFTVLSVKLPFQLSFINYLKGAVYRDFYDNFLLKTIHPDLSRTYNFRFREEIDCKIRNLHAHEIYA